RYSLLVHGVQIGKHSWDAHSDVQGGMIRHSREVDQPVAALLTDLEERGLGGLALQNGVRPVARRAVAELYEQADQVWHW
ncbi:MAG: DUF1501 domain-containing protein, partial [Alcanivorax sp.]|nr:DUF1501 domain-containing protein [Alcanivorax sp.]